MRTPQPLRPLVRPLILAALVAAGCKPSGVKTTVGPFTADRYETTAEGGGPLSCYVFGADTSKPARLCGEGGPTPGGTGALFEAVAPAADSKFPTDVGQPLEPGVYLIKAIGSSKVDAWFLGRPTMREWLGGGKLLLAVDTGADHHTRVRLIDPAARAERTLEAGQTKADSFLLVRAPGDAALLLVQRLGGEELILVREPLANPELLVADASDEKSAGGRKLMKRGDLDRLRGGVFKPTLAVLSSFSWKGTEPLFEGAPLGPFTPR